MARATPFLGYEGPGATFLKVGGVQLIHSGSDASSLLLGGRFVGEMTLLRFYVLHCVAIPLAVGAADRRPLLARPQGRRHQRADVTRRAWPVGRGPFARDHDPFTMAGPCIILT